MTVLLLVISNHYFQRLIHCSLFDSCKNLPPPPNNLLLYAPWLTFSTHTEMTKLGAFQIYLGNCFVIILLRHTRFNIWNLCSYFSTLDKYVSALK